MIYHYKTVKDTVTKIQLTERKSKFYGYVFPITDSEMVKPLISDLKNKYPNANHVCYAWQTGIEEFVYRANDDGEPNNTAGMPIYGQIQSYGITNVLVAVVRVFGGVKLGAGGLISAYKETAKLSLEAAKIVKKTILVFLVLHFEYADMDVVMRMIKKYDITIISQDLQLRCELKIAVKKKKYDEVLALLKSKMHTVEVHEV